MTVRSATPGPGVDAHLDVTLGAFRLDAPLRVEPGTVVALLGPNGAGKTTALRALAGLVPLDAGHVHLDGTALADPAARLHRPPERRAVAMVFQDHLLFPHLSALDNIAFGLRARGTAKDEARRQAAGWLERLGLADRSGDRPDRLSGGQAQRVALARALATSPRLLLLDEPLAALDAGTRATVRRDLRRHLENFDGATVVVTHDPLDALALASHVVILEAGRITQTAPIAEITRRPRSRYVAELIGLNLLHGTARGTTVTVDGTGVTITVAEPAGGRVHALIHPRAVALHTTRPDGSPRNRWPGRIEGFDLLGDRVRVRVTGEVPLVAEITPAAVTALDLREGGEVWTAVKATEIETYPA
jgi:molybdate transport system ATP-binding protein